jgi:DNA repair and recombination RAD54-like protein
MAHFNPALSGKMTVLVAMLEQTKSQTNDRFVLVSNFTKTLDLMHLVCQDHGWKTVRLDGSTKNQDRQNIVDRFNDDTSATFIFLLSSKAGGCGLNLIGANRLVLFDPAWNPATDRQAMARVWRDGQKKSVFIYRMLSTATLEERVYQRQILKEEVAAAVVDRGDSGGGGGGGAGGGSNSSSDDSRNFSPDELKKLFAAPHDTNCDTYDLITSMKGHQSVEVEEDEEDEMVMDEDDEDDEEENNGMALDEEDTNGTGNGKKRNILVRKVDQSKVRAQRAVLFKLYTGPDDVNDSVLRSVIVEDKDKLVTFVRTTSTTDV